jgi:hypothetical protein
VEQLIAPAVEVEGNLSLVLGSEQLGERETRPVEVAVVPIDVVSVDLRPGSHIQIWLEMALVPR